ncbi:MAG: amidase [Alphaproteobacteria bacterium]|nr:amidase [Alphaproteobacteria bacterium]
MTELNRFSATEIVDAITSGDCSAEDVTRACLARIDKREFEVGAFEYLDPAYAIEQAKVLDDGPVRGPLHGVPVAIKDIMDTFDMPTGWGFDPYGDRTTEHDASAVALCRQAGAVILGKTVTSEFAAFHPRKTRNPHNIDHTPGVSSMGAAAGAADFMFPVGFGTQTGGSIIRPAACCGVIGYKPTFDDLPLDGVMVLGQMLDTLGFLTRDLEDCALMRAALLGDSTDIASRDTNSPPRVALIRTRYWDQAEPIVHAVMESTVETLTEEGVRIEEPDMPEGFDELGAAHGTIMPVGSAQARAYEYQQYRDEMSDVFREHVEEGQATDYADFERAVELSRKCRAALDPLFDRYDVFLTPSAPGEALAGTFPTGEAMFNRFWTLLHVPLVHLPVSMGPQGLPVGVQLVGRHGADRNLLSDAQWILERLN